MKAILAIFRPHRLDDVLRELTARGIVGATLFEVQGYGQQMGHEEVFKGVEYKVNIKPKRALFVAVRDEEVARAMEAIRKGAVTGNIGDGKIFVLPLDEVLRVRTGESGTDAL